MEERAAFTVGGGRGQLVPGAHGFGTEYRHEDALIRGSHRWSTQCWKTSIDLSSEQLLGSVEGCGVWIKSRTEARALVTVIKEERGAFTLGRGRGRWLGLGEALWATVEETNRKYFFSSIRLVCILYNII